MVHKHNTNAATQQQHLFVSHSVYIIKILFLL